MPTRSDGGHAETKQVHTTTPGIPRELLQFLEALFAPTDHISFRPIETWTESNGRKHSRVIFKHAKSMRLDVLKHWLPDHLQMLEAEQANGFFGVCPRQKQNKDMQCRS